MFMTDVDRRKIKEEFFEIIKESGQRRGSMLSPELAAPLLNTSVKIVRLLADAVIALDEIKGTATADMAGVLTGADDWTGRGIVRHIKGPKIP